MRSRCLSFLVVLAAAGHVVSASSSERLPTGQILAPAGKSVSLEGTMAANLVAIPRRPWVAVICSGARQSLSIVDIAAGKVLSTIQYQELNTKHTRYSATGSVYFGLAVSDDGKTLYAARGGEDKIASYTIGRDGSLTPLAMSSDAPVAPAMSNFPSGIALDPAKNVIYAANNLSDTLATVALASDTAAPVLDPVHSYPLAVAFDSKHGEIYVSSERDSAISVINTAASRPTGTIAVGSHPDSLLLSSDKKYLYVANGDSDSVSIVDTLTDTVARTLLLRPVQVSGLPGATPTGLALSTDQLTLYVTLADMNALAVVKLSPTRTDGAVIGYIPTGWYPSAVTLSHSGQTLVVANAKGSAAANPNPRGPNPVNHFSVYRGQNILTSSLSLIPIPDAKTLSLWTKQVLAHNAISASIDPDSHRAASLLSSLPIKHVIYIIKENRTYDEVLGDMPQGNGDPSLVLFGKNVTPNLHALADDFVLLDNFYCCAEVSADGWNWSTSGLAEEYTQRTVPEVYSEGDKARPGVRSYDYEGENRELAVSDRGMPDVAESPGGYIWDAVAKAGLSYRDYGAFLSSDGDRPAKPALLQHMAPNFSPFDMKYPDSDAYVKLHLPSPGKDSFGPSAMPSRYSAWKAEFDGFVKNKDLPAFELVRMPRDHTAGTSPGSNTPQAMAADNDYGVGEIVQAVSHSPYWRSSAIVVVEDDAQDGPDHVDCHRSTAYVISPYIKRHTVDHHFYNTDSLLRTMEILLHVRPMTRLDASAPAIGAFTKAPDLTAYTAVVPNPSLLSAFNQRTAYGASQSRRMNFAVADDIPEDAMNQILWKSIKGSQSTMPPPRRGVLGE